MPLYGPLGSGSMQSPPLSLAVSAQGHPSRSNLSIQTPPVVTIANGCPSLEISLLCALPDDFS